MYDSSTSFAAVQEPGHTSFHFARGPAAGDGWPKPAAPADGLSQAHISAQVEYACGGSLIKSKIPGPSVHKRGIRGKVKGFSKGSRGRLLEHLHRVRRDSPAVFLTLTYPGEYDADPRVWKRHLNNFDRALDRAGLRPLSACWKLEPQKRGAPHFHLIVFGVTSLKGFRAWAAETWYRIVNSGDTKHLRAGISASWVRSHHGIISYASKYMGKLIDGEEWEPGGRCWGFFNRKDIPWADLLIADVPIAFAQKLKRWLRRATGYQYISHFGQKFYLDCPEAWFLRLDEQIALSP